VTKPEGQQERITTGRQERCPHLIRTSVA
jgi:hypothetical protein